MKGIFTVIGPAGQRHTILIVIVKNHGDFTINATYESGDLPVPQGTTVVKWTSYFEAPFGEDPGFVDIGAGSRYIELPELRGVGLGSFFMALMIEWAQSLPEVPVATIYLSIDDAKTSAAKNSRNQFWRKLGFELILDETDSFGKSKPMLNSQLIRPELNLADGWQIAEMR